MSLCTHTRPVWIPEELDPYDGSVVTDGHYATQSATEDIDVHRYRCTQCGKVMYYSGRAEAFYERGVKSPGVRGLS